MKLSPWFLAAVAPLAFLGSGAIVGHLAVLAVTFGIFFGTLSLDRHRSGSTAQTPAGPGRTAHPG